jgi:hypothetical protein
MGIAGYGIIMVDAEYPLERCMKRWLMWFVRLLDGQPVAGPPRTQLGQSLTEMALTTPILVLMLFGLVEIGWLANHQIILTEVSRVGARSGSQLTGDLGPLAWEEDASVPKVLLDGIYGVPLTDPRRAIADVYRNCPVTQAGFFNVIACNMLLSMEPLTLKFGDKVVRNRDGSVNRLIPYPDDIIVSVFALQVINNDDDRLNSEATPVPYPYGHQNRITWDFTANGMPYERGVQLVVAGRYPTNANECTLDADGNPSAERDPFDMYSDDLILNNTFTELRQVDGDDVDFELEGHDAVPEYVRGFTWTGQKRIHDFCWGSEFTDDAIARLINLQLLGLTEQERIKWVPSQSIVLAEIYWMHEPLLPLGFFTPVFAAITNAPENIEISGWSAFPIRETTPDLRFHDSE